VPHDKDKAHGKDGDRQSRRPTETLGDGLGELLGDPKQAKHRAGRQERADGEAGDAISPNEGAQEDAQEE
jgi:hypothetical protein